MDHSAVSCSTVGSATFPGTFSATVRLRELGLEGANEKCYMFLPAVEFDDKTIVFGKIGPRGCLKQINFLFVANGGLPVLPLFKTISF